MADGCTTAAISALLLPLWNVVGGENTFECREVMPPDWASNRKMHTHLACHGLSCQPTPRKCKFVNEMILIGIHRCMLVNIRFKHQSDSLRRS